MLLSFSMSSIIHHHHSCPPPPAMIRLRLWIPQRELFIEQDSSGISSPLHPLLTPLGSRALRQTHACLITCTLSLVYNQNTNSTVRDEKQMTLEPEAAAGVNPDQG